MEGSGFEVCLVKTLIVDYSVESECAGKKENKGRIKYEIRETLQDTTTKKMVSLKSPG